VKCCLIYVESLFDALISPQSVLEIDTSKMTDQSYSRNCEISFISTYSIMVGLLLALAYVLGLVLGLVYGLVLGLALETVERVTPSSLFQLYSRGN
jgi:hypothetical protein